MPLHIKTDGLLDSKMVARPQRAIYHGDPMQATARATSSDLALRNITRRRWTVVVAGTVASAIAAPVVAQSGSIRIGSTFDNSGVEKHNGASCFLGARACFEAINREGGIHGKQLTLIQADDQFNPQLAKSNAKAFQADRTMLGLLTPLGTRQTAAVMEAVGDMAIVGPNTGTAALRKTSPPNLFWVRASYDQEVERLVATSAALGHTRIGIVYPDDPLGKSVYAGFERSIAAHGLTPAVVATTPGTTSLQVEPAAMAVATAAPQVVIMVMAGVAPRFVQALRKLDGGRTTIYGLSISINAENVRAMGEYGRGVGFSIIVPSPFVAKSDIVRRYQTDLRALGDEEHSLPALEGYINARVLVEGLRLAGPNATRETLIKALERIEALDLGGGMRIGYGRGNRVGSHFVDLAVIDAAGRIRT
jgi:branched-chain amino acid transport system substrate-binding protein